MQEQTSFFVAFFAGLMTFLSPCVLPLIPSYISYITGISFKDFSETKDISAIRRKTALHSATFILAFSIVFTLFGATASFIGKFLAEYQHIIMKVGGVIIVVLGLHIAGVFNWSFLMKERKVHLQRKEVSLIGTFLIGLTFAAAWTPCAGPILGSILVYASSTSDVKLGMGLLFTYSMGLGVPFFLSAIMVNNFLFAYKKFQKYLVATRIVAGLFLVIMGVVVFTNSFGIISAYLQSR